MLVGRTTIGTVAYMGGILSTPEPFTKAWGDMIQYNYEYVLSQNERIQYVKSSVSYHSFARDSLIDQMQGDWILMIDTDVIFEPDVVGLMLNKLEVYNIDVLAGIYPFKGTVHAPVLYGYNKKKKERFIVGDWDDKVDILPMDSAGAGCLMIRKSVVEKIKAKGESLFAIIEPFSEDISFFQRLKKITITPYFSPHIRLKHLVYDGLTIEEDYPKGIRKAMVGKRQEVIGYK